MSDVIQPRGWVQDADRDRIVKALAARDAAQQEVRDAVRAATSNGASVRELAALTGLAPATIQRWRTEA